MQLLRMRALLAAPALLALCCAAAAHSPARAAVPKDVRLTRIGTYASGINAGAEIVSHDPKSQRLFVVNANPEAPAIDVLDIRDPSKPVKRFSIPISPYGGGVNSVDVSGGVVAAAVEASPKQDPGKVVFFDSDGNFLSQVTVGALPDMIAFTHNGNYVLTCNEGEPNADYTVDPEGSVSIIDVRRGAKKVTQADVSTAGFGSFTKANIDPRIRIYGPGASVAQDLEPEYLTTSGDSKTAYVTVQENNALAIVDIPSATVTSLKSLGFKDHRLPGNGLDPSDRDGGIRIGSWPVYGMYQPDSIASFVYRGRTYLVTANEGDAREYLGVPGFVEEARVGGLTLDPVAFPNGALLKSNANLGRLTVTRTLGDFDGDGDYDALFPLGARSFSIWTAGAELVYDSGSDLERITALAVPTVFNSNGDPGTFDTRSDNKGPEPEALTLGEIDGRTYAFLGLERTGGIAVYDITDPNAPRFVQYVNPTAAGESADVGPEGLKFIKRGDSPIQKPLLAVASEVSGTTTIYRIDPIKQ